MTDARPDAVIAVSHLSKWYGQISGLNDASLTLSYGVTGLLGPNGAGKSTLMKLVTGQLRPSQGGVAVFGAPIWGNPSVYARIGVCPEQDAFYERMTGLEWVTGLLRLHGFLEKDAAAAAARALETVDLMDVANRKIGSYSKGMRQRVKLAQAFAHDPELLVLDEPLAGMDPLARRQIIRLIRNWGAARKTVVVSSHVLHEVEAMTSHVVLMNQGTVIADGDLHQLRELIDEHPHTVHVRCRQNRALARALLAFDDVIGLRLEEQVVIVQTSRPDAFYARLTGLAASGDVGDIDEISSPDDNLQAVFAYLVK